MKGTPFDVFQYIRLRKEIILRKPFYITYKDYILSYMQCFLLFCYNKGEIKRLKKRRELFEKAQFKLVKAFDGVKLIKQIQKFNIIKSVMLEKRQRKLIKFAKKNTIDYSSDEKEYFSKDWQQFLEKLGMLRKVVDGSLTNKTDA